MVWPFVTGLYGLLSLGDSSRGRVGGRGLARQRCRASRARPGASLPAEVCCDAKSIQAIKILSFPPRKSCILKQLNKFSVSSCSFSDHHPNEMFCCWGERFGEQESGEDPRGRDTGTASAVGG